MIRDDDMYKDTALAINLRRFPFEIMTNYIYFYQKKYMVLYIKSGNLLYNGVEEDSILNIFDFRDVGYKVIKAGGGRGSSNLYLFCIA